MEAVLQSGAPEVTVVVVTQRSGPDHERGMLAGRLREPAVGLEASPSG